MQRRSLLWAAGASVALSVPCVYALAQSGIVKGAGTALSNSVLRKWAELAGPGTGLNVTYEASSGYAALDQIKVRAVDFASVDYAKRSALLRDHQLVQFPAMLVAAIPFVNLPGVADNQLRLTGEVLADMYLGKITKWNDAKIKALNSDVNLPSTTIVPIHRSDSCGSTLLLTTFLSRNSESWLAGPRSGSQVQWPAGVGGSAEGQEGMGAKVKATPGAIGYGGVTAIKASGLPQALLKNAAGEFVRAEPASFAKAAEAEDWSSAGFSAVDMVDEHAAGAWPIVGANYALVAADPPAEKVEAVRSVFRFFDWAFKNGATAAGGLGYAGIPQGAIPHVEAAWRQAKGPNGRPIWEA